MGIAKGSEGFVKALRDRLFSHIQKLPFAWHSQHQTGEIIQRCTSDVEVVRNFVCNQLVEVFRTVFLVALSMGIMFSMNVRISLIALGFIPLIVLYSAFFYSRIAKRFRTADEAEGVLSSTVQENLTAYVLYALSAENRLKSNDLTRKTSALQICGSIWGSF